MLSRPRRTPRRRATLLLASLLLPCLLGRPAAGAEEDRAADPLLIGAHVVSVGQVVDGDTLRLPNGKGSVRILNLDCEETFKDEQDRAAAAADFAAYAQAKRGSGARPVKFGTPAGEAARTFLQRLVAGCRAMRVERDRVGARERGTYGRLLGHVLLVRKDGTRVNLAEAMIRAGHSPYSIKYGRSARFEAAFSKAQAEARKARRGIWGDTGPAHYPDYAERLTWWAERARQLAAWHKLAGKADHVTLGTVAADEKLAALVGKEAVVFGLLERELKVRGGDKRIFLLSHRRRRGFALVCFDLEVAKALAARERFHSMYVTVRAKVTLHRGRPQMVLERADQVRTEKP